MLVRLTRHVISTCELWRKSGNIAEAREWFHSPMRMRRGFMLVGPDSTDGPWSNSSLLAASTARPALAIVVQRIKAEAA